MATLGFAGTAAEVVNASRTWWAEHGLDFPAVPDPGTPEHGLSAFAFPAPAVQLAQREAVLGLGRYGEDASVIDTLVTAVTGRPDGPYLLVLDEEIPEWSRGLTASALRRALAAHDRIGLTVLEYLVLQRRAFEVSADHRFHDYTAIPAGWSWLPASTSGPVHAMAYYYGKTDRVEISGCKAGSTNPRKGAHTARLVPLG